jgi:glycosyltransferase involved in cell wall biosynthesis
LANEYPDLKLQLIGRGRPNLVEQLLQKSAAAGHPDLVEVVGYVQREKLPEYLSRAHVFAAPSFYEGGPGFVYLEAMACELPVVAAQGSGVAEVVEDCITGHLVLPGDVEALYLVLARLVSDEELRRSIGRRGREFVERHADSSECMQKLESFYRDVVQRCQRSLEHV